MNIYRCKSEVELRYIGNKLLEKHPDKRIFAFFGPMGVGKTSFIKVLSELLGAGNKTASPTFSIINEYKTSNGKSIYHFDFYRINAEEAFDIGYEEYFFSGDYCFIEWGDKIRHLLPDNSVIVEMKEVGGFREISFK